MHALLKCQQKSQGLLFMFTLYTSLSLFSDIKLTFCKLNASVTLNDLEQSCQFNYDSLRL